jgi:hypothetical protein
VRNPIRRIATLLLTLVTPALLSAQEHQHGPALKVENGGVFPPGWTVRVDDGGKLADVSLAAMAPGWHLITAESGIIYRAQDAAKGAYEVAAKIHLFPGSGHEEAFGLFIGGSDLAGPAQRYTYFLIRGDGKFKIKRRAGASATDVTRDWISSTAIVPMSAKGPVANVLSLQVGKDKVSFRVNGQEIYSAPAASIDTDGIVGFRVNHNLSLHLESLEIRK